MKIWKAYPTRILKKSCVVELPHFNASSIETYVWNRRVSWSFTPFRFRICIVLMTWDCLGGIGYEIRDSWMHVVSTKAIIFVRVIASWMHRLWFIHLLMTPGDKSVLQLPYYSIHGYIVFHGLFSSCYFGFVIVRRVVNYRIDFN